MKLIQINVTLKNGSTGRIAYQLHEYLDANGVHNTIAFGYGDKTDPAGFSLHGRFGTHLHSFLSRKLCMQGLCSVWQTGKLIRYLKQEKPDIIHLHNIHGHYLNYVMLFRFLKKLDKPVVWTLHDCWAFTGKCAHYFTAGCQKWKTACCDCPNLPTYPDSIFDGSRRNYRLKKSSFSEFDKLNIVCNSEWLKSQVLQSFLKDQEICRIYNGVDTNIFNSSDLSPAEIKRKYGIPVDKFLILGVSGIWKESKGLHAFYRLAEQLDDDGVIALVGVIPEQKSPLPGNIIHVTKTEDINALTDLYSAADVLVNPSQEETFGMVAAEAMACGTPVIVSHTTACPEIIAHNTGYIVDTKNTDEILHAIQQIKLTGKSQYQRACVANIAENFSVEQMCNNYWKLYQNLSRRETQ